MDLLPFFCFAPKMAQLRLLLVYLIQAPDIQFTTELS